MQYNHNFIKANEKEAYALANSQHADEIINAVDIADAEQAENEFTALLKLISDTDLRDRLDTAAGNISAAYQKLGFMAGYLLEKAFNHNE